MDTQLFSAHEAALAGSLIREGHLVVFPTETVYGLGADVFNEDACKHIFTAKGRPQDNPLITHIHDREQLHALVTALPPGSQDLIRCFWPGPLTLVLPKRPDVSAVVSASLDTIGVRMPSHPVARAFLRSAGTPVAAPSANRSGKPSPTNFAMACEAMNGRVAGILDGGACESGLESTVIAWDGKRWNILRPGSVTREQLAEVIEDLLEDSILPQSDKLAVRSPGTRHPHYKPRGKVILFTDPADLTDDNLLSAGIGAENIMAVLCLSSVEAEVRRRTKARQVYSYADWKALARNLYSDFHRCDIEECTHILVHTPIESTGIAEALQNRLKKAAEYTI